MKPSPTVLQLLRELPSVEQLVSNPSLVEYFSQIPRPLVVREGRLLLDEIRTQLETATVVLSDAPLVAQLESRIKKLLSSRLQRVINATGILVHTNLGRAPLLNSAIIDVAEQMSGYNNLEFNLQEGTRGSRGAYAELLLAELTGADAVAVVNNCAAALVVIVNSLGNRRDVIISRSELVQIGGGFRIPDILIRSGAKLKEVGTTNITNLADYAGAISPRTGLILKVHQSNFIQKGFQSSVSIDELGRLARENSLPLVYDLGSGLLDTRGHSVLENEPTAHSALQSGSSLVCFSGDKLLGGTQTKAAGVATGRFLEILLETILSTRTRSGR